MRTLVLNAGYEPLAVVSFRRALVLVLAGKATVIADGGNPVVGGTLTLPRPSVILLARYVRAPHGRAVAGQPPRGAAPRRAPVRVLRRPRHHRRPRPAAQPRRRVTPGRTWWPAACAATTPRATGRRRRRAGRCGSGRTRRAAPPGSSAGRDQRDPAWEAYLGEAAA